MSRFVEERILAGLRRLLYAMLWVVWFRLDVLVHYMSLMFREYIKYVEQVLSVKPTTCAE